MSGERLNDSLDLDLAPTAEIVRLIQQQDRIAVQAVAAAADRITQAVDSIADRLQNGGRMFYVGAGTSGRIAMLDASELPPTYGVSPDLVQVIMAGGEGAFLGAVEGAEDRDEEAVREIESRVTADDAVVGIAASGTTPFTLAAIRKANMLGALTVSVTSVTQSPLAQEADIAVVTVTGPEVVMGSTRMKAGTAQKLVLNAISTAVMVRLGRVYSNLMTDMPITNAKLGRRALRMVELAAGVDRFRADRALKEAGGEVKTAIVIASRDVDAETARAMLAARRGNLREALQS